MKAMTIVALAVLFMLLTQSSNSEIIFLNTSFTKNLTISRDNNVWCNQGGISAKSSSYPIVLSVFTPTCDILDSTLLVAVSDFTVSYDFRNDQYDQYCITIHTTAPQYITYEDSLTTVLCEDFGSVLIVSMISMFGVFVCIITCCVKKRKGYTAVPTEETEKDSPSRNKHNKNNSKRNFDNHDNTDIYNDSDLDEDDMEMQ